MNGTDRKLKILMVITTLDMGGAEKHLLLLSQGLIHKGHLLELVYLKGRGSLAPQFEALGVRVEKIAMDSMTGLARAIFHLRKKVRQGDYDLVHSHLLKADLVAACAGPRVLVASKHNDERALLNPVFSLVHGIVSAVPRRVIVLSDHVGRFVVRHGRVPREKIERIYYGLDSESFRAGGHGSEDLREELGIRPGTPVITMVARFAPQKDHGSLLEAARLLREAGLDYHLLLVGDDPFGDHRKRAEAHCRALDLEDRVTFTGVRTDVPRILAMSRIFVMPSNWEGLGLVFLEAMAFSLPVVSTKVSAIPEIVAEGETGLLVPPGRAEALMEALAEFLRYPEKAEQFGRAGKERLVRRFGLGKMIEETEKVYYRVLG